MYCSYRVIPAYPPFTVLKFALGEATEIARKNPSIKLQFHAMPKSIFPAEYHHFYDDNICCEDYYVRETDSHFQNFQLCVQPAVNFKLMILF